MGTTVQCKSYFSGYYSMRDLNEDADSSWFRYHEDRTLGGHFYNGFALRLEDGYSEYDKEMLKRTMLEHEAVFRKQVYELHRLYRIQKDLMDEFQKKRLYRYSVPVDTSHSNSFLSQMPSEVTKIKWQMPQMPEASNGYNVTFFAVTNDIKPPINFFKESSVQSSNFPIENGICLKDGHAQEPELKKFPKRTFGLQLPADVYTDTEDADSKGSEPVANSSSKYLVPSDKPFSAEPRNDVKLTLGTGECFNLLQDSWKSNSHKQNGIKVHNLVDLNQPIGELSHEVASSSSPLHFLHPKTQLEENLGLPLPVRSNTSFLAPQGVLFKDKHSDESSCSRFPFMDKDEVKWQWPFRSNEAGESRRSASLFGSGLQNEKLSVSSEPIQLKSIQSHGVLSPYKTDAWFRQKPSLGIEFPGRNPCLAVPSNPGPLASGTSSSFLVSPNLKYTCTSPSLVSASPKPANSISHISQVLPCFSESATKNIQTKRPDTAIQDSINTSDKWQHKGDLRQCLKLGSEALPYSDGFHCPAQLDSNSACFDKVLGSNNNGSVSGILGCYGPQKHLKALQCTNVMSEIDVCVNQEHLNRICDVLTTQQDIGISAVEGKCRATSAEISWLTSKPSQNEYVDLNKCASQMELGFTQGCLQLISKISLVNPGLERKEEEKGPLTCNLEDFHSTSQVKNRMQGSEAYDNLRCTKILGFPVDRIHQSAICSPLYQEQSMTSGINSQEKDASNYVELSPVIDASKLENQISGRDLARSNSTRARSHINLNSAYVNHRSSRNLPPEGEVEVPSRLAVPTAAEKVAPMIDLEEPIISQLEENPLPQEECMPRSIINDFPQTACFHVALVKEAAENIIQISKGNMFDGRCSQLPPAPSDTLQWFAEVVFNTEHAKGLRGRDSYSECSDDGLDHFELMTLKLQELKSDEYWCRPWEPISQQEEPQSAASLLLSKPRRGQARKRRQRRDFQKDILPGLASLSRQEVTEDLQTIGALMKASGKSWQAGLMRRNTGRKGLHSPARGRKRPTSLAATVIEVGVSSLQPQPTHAESEVDGTTIIGWGRTTRRCRRQRCLPVTIAAPLI